MSGYVKQKLRSLLKKVGNNLIGPDISEIKKSVLKIETETEAHLTKINSHISELENSVFKTNSDVSAIGNNTLNTSNGVAWAGAIISELRELTLYQQTLELQEKHSNPLNKFGKKCFSQSDEDGITLEIIRRIGIQNGTYAEFGVGNGLENNTLILAALGWHGFWVGGEDLAFDYTKSKKFTYIKDWITLENVSLHAKRGTEFLNDRELDVISLDLDGNDLYFVRDLLEKKFHPKLFIVEYNAKFPPPVKFNIEYNPTHQWMHDDYYGASLCSFVELFSEFDYTLICCNSHSGANAFFVKNELLDLFRDVPTEIEDIFVGPRFFLYRMHGHKQSVKVLERIFSD